MRPINTSRPVRPAASVAPPPSGGGGGRATGPMMIVGGILALIASLAVVGWVVYNVNIKPVRDFDPITLDFPFERDAASDDVVSISVEEIFSKERTEAYLKNGDGFNAIFRVKNDPREKYTTGEKTCSLVPASKHTGTKNRARQREIDQAQANLEQCVQWFGVPLSIVRTVEIGLDDTDGVTKATAEWVRQHLSGLSSKMASSKDDIKLYVFRLSGADYRDYRQYDIPKDSSEQKAEQALNQALDWLLQTRPASANSSVATGLFNALNLNRDIRAREVYVFSDGMENSPQTASFYRAVNNHAFLAPTEWDKLDSLVSRLEAFPDLSSAKVRWYLPPRPGAHLRLVRDYWQHVLTNRCKAATAEVIY